MIIPWELESAAALFGTIKCSIYFSEMLFLYI